MADERPPDGPDDEPSPSSPADDDRRANADDRDRTADGRDRVSEAHDKVSESRDDRAEERDRRAERRELADPEANPDAASDRAGAWRDRRGGVADRTHAADDRVAASTDRAISARERASSSIDELTGAHRRDPGMVELGREVARAKRTGTPLVLVFIDVDGLKRTNDSLGHAAGDELLHRVVRTVRSHCRPYDLIIRYGGDEFLCVLVDATLATANERFSLVGADLAAEPRASISIGVTELAASDVPDDLIARADADLRAGRRRRAAPER